jgi:hypothetical protein
MTKYSFAKLDQWALKTKKRMDVVVKQSVTDMIADIEIVPAMARGGTPQKGTIPKDFGALARSLQSTLYGSTSLSQQGEDSHILVVGNMEAGDVARFSWGGNVAPYARAIHYGFGTYPGTFWIDVAQTKWQSYVASAVRRAKAQVNG